MAGQFALDISKFVAKAELNADLVVRKIALDIFARVIRRTPVRTGRARGNWQSSVSHMVLEQTGVIDKSGRKARDRVLETVEAAHSGDVIYLTNTLPYIMRLEEGSSQQAPAGMVGVTVQEYRGVVERAANEVKK